MKKALLFGAFLLSSKLFSQETEIEKNLFFVNPETEKKFHVLTKTANLHAEKIITDVKKNSLKIYLQKVCNKNINIFNTASGNFYCLPDFSEHYFKRHGRSSEDNVVMHGKIKVGHIDIEFKRGHNISGFRNGSASIILMRKQGTLLFLLVLPKSQAVLLTGFPSLACLEMKIITGSGASNKK